MFFGSCKCDVQHKLLHGIEQKKNTKKTISILVWSDKGWEMTMQKNLKKRKIANRGVVHGPSTCPVINDKQLINQQNLIAHFALQSHKQNIHSENICFDCLLLVSFLIKNYT